MIYLAALLFLASASAQRVDITGIPQWGKKGTVDGRVSGIDPGRISVVVFSRVKGFNIQPGCARTVVDPGVDGMFSARITGDRQAGQFVALMVPRGFVARCHFNEARIPDYIEAQTIASDFRIRPARGDRVIHWSGYEFIVRQGKGGPGNCFYDRRNVRVDHKGLLHLTVRRRGGKFTCAEVVMTRSLGGLGTYRFTVETELEALSPALVFGAFTYSGTANREIDFAEVSKWGKAEDPKDAQFVVQPSEVDGNVHRFGLNGVRAFEAVWGKDEVVFRAGPESWRRAVPFKPLDQTLHFNLWTFRQPGNGAEVVLRGMEFKAN